VPKLWDDTIEAHRQAVRVATLDATAAIVAKHGLRAVTMSKVAEATGIGRATLYKYFPDVEAILVAWHERQVFGHLEQLARLRDRTEGSVERLEVVLEAYALVQHEHPSGSLASLLHEQAHMSHAEQQLTAFIESLITAGARSGALRDDVAASELATYSLRALGAAGELPSKAAVRRLVVVTLDGLRAGR